VALSTSDREALLSAWIKPSTDSEKDRQGRAEGMVRDAIKAWPAFDDITPRRARLLPKQSVQRSGQQLDGNEHTSAPKPYWRAGDAPASEARIQCGLPGEMSPAGDEGSGVLMIHPVVFCIHASPDKPQVLAFADRLRADGFDPWVDRTEIGGGALGARMAAVVGPSPRLHPTSRRLTPPANPARPRRSVEELADQRDHRVSGSSKDQQHDPQQTKIIDQAGICCPSSNGCC
jgi:hypothetical protein